MSYKYYTNFQLCFTLQNSIPYTFATFYCFSCYFRLGPCNTRLMQAYYNFDARIPLLVPIVRLWMKVIGPPRSQINNYAVSLMLIYALQRCSPPVLPCLQNPGAWPKNMSWFAEKGFSVSSKRKEESIVVGRWRCEFTPPQSLLPSANTESPGTKHCLRETVRFS